MARFKIVTDDEYVKRWLAKCTVTDKGCWQWKELKRHPKSRSDPYPKASYKGRKVYLHRAMVAIHQRPLLLKEMACHTCDNHLCINPDHLWIGINRENLLDASRKKRYPAQAKTHCKHGHEFSNENTRLTKKGFTIVRQCKECKKLRNTSRKFNHSAGVL